MRHTKLIKPTPVDKIEAVQLTVTQTELDYLTAAVGGSAGPYPIAGDVLEGLQAAGGRGTTSLNPGLFHKPKPGVSQLEWRKKPE